jgi:hypothetical protein
MWTEARYKPDWPYHTLLMPSSRPGFLQTDRLVAPVRFHAHNRLQAQRV